MRIIAFFLLTGFLAVRKIPPWSVISPEMLWMKAESFATIAASGASVAPPGYISGEMGTHL